MNHTHPSTQPTPLDPAGGPQRQAGTLRWAAQSSAEAASVWPVQSQDPYATLRSHGGRAHQLRTSLHAADHYLARGRKDERGDDPATAIWLVTCSLNLAAELSTGLHRLNKRLRTEQIHPELRPTVSAMRRQACQLHAMARATAHFLAQPGRNDNEVGSWLIVTARSLAQSLAEDIDAHCKASTTD
jgi:hypothetical protein